MWICVSCPLVSCLFAIRTMELTVVVNCIVKAINQSINFVVSLDSRFIESAIHHSNSSSSSAATAIEYTIIQYIIAFISAL